MHFNHQLRGAESDADEQFVATLAAERGFDFLAGRGDVAGEARTRGWNLEDAARRLRYAFFSSAAQTAGVTHVAVAHTADDQAETVLARLVRGTGPAGLAAIYPVKGDVVRPLLEVRRSELREYLERRSQPWREDTSNLDTTRLRARLRHQVLPVIERELQPGIVAHLSRLAQMAREDEAFWAALVAERLGALARREPGRLGIRCADLLTPLHSAAPTSPKAQLGPQLALAKRLVRGLVEELQGSRAAANRAARGPGATPGREKFPRASRGTARRRRRTQLRLDLVRDGEPASSRSTPRGARSHGISREGIRLRETQKSFPTT